MSLVYECRNCNYEIRPYGFDGLKFKTKPHSYFCKRCLRKVLKAAKVVTDCYINKNFTRLPERLYSLQKALDKLWVKTK